MHSTREPLPSRTIERPVVLSKGWSEVRLALDHGRATRGFDPSGTRRELGAAWTTWTSSATLRLGLAPGVEIFSRLPFVVSRAEVQQQGFGTVVIGARFGLHREAPSRSVAVELAGRLPLGFSGGSLEQGARPLSTGTSDLVLALLGRFGWNGLVFDGRIATWYRFGGSPAWAGASFRPGVLLLGQGGLRIQAGPLVFGPEGAIRWRGATRFAGEREIGGAGWQLNGGARVSLEFSRGVDAFVRLETVVLGEGQTWARLPDLDPVKRRTLGVGLRLRW